MMGDERMLLVMENGGGGDGKIRGSPVSKESGAKAVNCM